MQGYASLEQFTVMNHNKTIASVNAHFNEVKPCPTPVRIYVENCNNFQQYCYVSHHKSYVEDTHVPETTTFFGSSSLYSTGVVNGGPILVQSLCNGGPHKRGFPS